MKKLMQKTFLVVTLLLGAATGAHSQTLTNNYVITSTPRLSGMTTDSAVAANSTDKTKVQISIQYVDGLGRSLQTVMKQASPLGYDMIHPQAYDTYGREVNKYLPYTPQTGTVGSFRPNAVSTDQAAFYTTPPSGSGVTAITDPYAQTAFDSSPLNRSVEQGAPGVPWQLTGVSGGGHTLKMVYTVNNDTLFATDSIKGRQVARYYCTVNSDTSRTLIANGYYPAGTLTVTIAKDENWVSGRAGTIEEYKDIDGHVVLKRQYNYTTAVQVLSTYYVYDDLGKLAFVLPPAAGADAAGTISQSTLNNLCYQYQYDEYGRPVQKRIPGKGWEYTVYNIMDQPVAIQDSLQRFKKQWIFTKYDALGSVIQTGIWNNGGTAISRASLQSTLNAISTNLYETPQNSGNGYTNVAWPTSNVTSTLSLQYYDTYANIPGLPAGYILSSGVSKLTRGLPTVKKTAVLNTPTDQLWDVMYYDDLGRSTQTFAQNYLGGVINNNNYDQTITTYNFPNQPTTVTRKHWTSASTSNPLVTVANTFYYDHIGRKRSTWEQITNGNNSPTTKTLISKMDYNEVGQVLTKHLHSTDSVNFYQNIAYTYNERGWLLGASAPLFAVNYYYNTLANKAWNGNIRYQYWGIPGNESYRYAYNYDMLNRITAGTSLSGNTEYTSYDLMGNIAGMSRYKTGTLIDNMSYTYLSGGNPTNQLQTVNDATTNDLGIVHGLTSYTYDGNGNMLTQTNPTNTQNKTVTYNLLNQPQSVTVPTGTVTYTYDATGQKLRKVAVISGVTTTTEYIAGIQYKNSTTAVDFIQTEEGKAVPSGANYDYTYYIGDNLGNTRLTFHTINGSAQSQQITNYYPFGMEIDSTLANPKNLYLYNRKESQDEFQEYDYGARFYDPVIGRWNVIDPLAEVSRRWSPYSYAENNPIRITDPDGMSVAAQIYNGLNSPDNSDETSPLEEAGKEAEKQQDQNAAIAKAKEGLTNFKPFNNSNDSNSETSSSVNPSSVATPNAGTNVVASVNNSIEAAKNSSGKKVNGDEKADQGDGQQHLTHAQELEKYGTIVGGGSISGGTAVGKRGYLIEYGYVITDKGYRQDYQTKYYVGSTVMISVGAGNFRLWNKGDNKTTFSDFLGPVTGYFLSIGPVTYTQEQSTTYRTFGLAFGWGVNVPKRGTAGYLEGTTTAIGKPYLMPADADSMP